MFIQVLEGAVGDGDAVRAELDRWMAEVAPDAPGWLGSTAGVTDEGLFIVVSRFATGEAARRTGERPRQQAWWARMSRLFTGEVSVEDYADVELFMEGRSDDAGLVQVVQGRTGDPARLRAVERELVRHIPETRSDVIGGVMGIHEDGTFTEVVYFTSEEHAAGCRGAPDPQIAELIMASRELTGKLDYYDLAHPWFYSPT